MIRINLDMDMPEECHECPFQLKFKDDEVDAWYIRRCVIMQRKIEYPRPEWCPLEYVSEGLEGEVRMNEEAIGKLGECLRLLDCVGTREKCEEYIAEVIAMLKEKPEIIRCKDCQHRPNDDLDFPDNECPCQCFGDPYCSWYPEDDWFCANGKEKE